jgi:peptidoglycan/LPS O-acetylase OafA/YrhL
MARLLTAEHGDTRSSYIPGLHGIRAVAALSVAVAHIEGYRQYFGLPSDGVLISGAIATNAVTVFFVLSGFLITLLLLRESTLTGRISIAKFYSRRVLRIWPLYFVVLFAGYYLFATLLPVPPLAANWHPGNPLQLLLFVFFLPNAANAFFGSISYVSTLWSIGVEEQFYSFWPWLVRRRTPQMLSVMLIVVALGVFALRLFVNYSGLFPWQFGLLANTMEFDSMAVGGIAALLFYLRGASGSSLPHLPYLALGAFAVIFAYSALGNPFRPALLPILSVAFAICILFVAGHPASFATRFFETGRMRWLGEISYGIYLLHSFVIIPMLHVDMIAGMLDTVVGSWLFRVVAIGLTIGVASLSYIAIERPFLRLKLKLSQT